MRITNIHVENFKSLVDFDFHLAKFTCLIGLNGSGKSTVLQFIDFLAQQMRGKIDDWLEERGWKSNEVLSQLSVGKTVKFTVQMVDGKAEVEWRGNFNPSRLQCTIETVSTKDAQMQVKDAKYSIVSRGKETVSGEIAFKFEGSILSQLRENVLPPSLLRFREFFRRTESLDMLTPERLRQKTRSADGSLGHGGRRLSAFVYELGADGRKQLSNRLKEAYSHLRRIQSKSLRSGWKQLVVSESFNGDVMRTDATHLNDGMLRMIAILAELASKHGLLLFDEIENGINPELVEFLLSALTVSEKQILVTTHSPLILNYLDDETATKGVTYLYKTNDGHTKAIPFFSIPSLKKKLAVMGPGEAFADTNLVELVKEIESVSEDA